MDAHKNFAYSAVATAPSPASSGTSLVVTAGTGAKFPAVPFNATVWPTGVLASTINAEIVRVTAISTDTLTIVRAQESSSARSVIVGDQISASITAKTLTDIETAITPQTPWATNIDGNGKQLTGVAAITATIPSGFTGPLYSCQHNDPGKQAYWQVVTVNGAHFLFGEIASPFPNGNPVDNSSPYGFLQCDGGLVVQLPGGGQGPMYADTVNCASFVAVGGIQVVGLQQPAIADSSDASNAASQLNLLLAAMRVHGLIAP